MKDNICADRIQPLSYDLFVGMDVDKKSIVMTIMDHNDDLIKSLNTNQKVSSVISRRRSIEKGELLLSMKLDPQVGGCMMNLEKIIILV